MTFAKGLMTKATGLLRHAITAAKFKATVSTVLAKASRTGTTIVVTKRGKPFVKFA